MNIKYGRGTYGNIILADNFKELGEDVIIGNFCSIALEVTAIVSGHNQKWVSSFPFTHKGYSNAKKILGLPVTYKISVGNDVWLGRKSLLIGNVEIGDGCVVGGGSVVRGKFEPYSIIIGNPAYCVRKRFSDDQIKKLLKIKWWDWSDEKINDNVKFLCSERIDDFINLHFKG